MKRRALINLLMVIGLVACGTKPTSNPNSTSASGAATLPGTASVTKPPVANGPATDGAPTSPAVPVSDCVASASFVADVTVQDNTLFEPGEKFKKIWRIKNTGTCTWSENYILVFAQGDRMNAPDSVPLKTTAPGETLDIAVTLKAPTEDTVTHARGDFEIHAPGGAAIPVDEATFLWVIIKVDNEVGGATHEDSGSGGGAATSSGPGYATVTCKYTTSQPNVDDVLAALNSYRAQYSLPAYQLNSKLSEAAQAHSADMACNSLFYHNGSNGSTSASRIAASGYVASAQTENVYGSYPPLSGADAVSWWASDTTDPRHNENLLSLKYTEIGIGYSFFNNFGYYVIDFAAP